MTPSDVNSEYFTGSNGIKPYSERVSGAPYFFNWGDMSEAGVYADMMPLDTLRYLIYVPDLTDEGVLYNADESYNIADVQPLKTEKIQTFEFGYVGNVVPGNDGCLASVRSLHLCILMHV